MVLKVTYKGKKNFLSLKLLILLDIISKETNLGYFLHLYNDLAFQQLLISCYFYLAICTLCICTLYLYIVHCEKNKYCHHYILTS